MERNKSTNSSIQELDAGQLGLMWSFLMLGKQKSNIPVLKQFCDQLRQAMIQKTAGQRKDDPGHYVDFRDLGTIVNNIVIETMCLYLSGDLDRLEKLSAAAGGGLTDGKDQI